MPEADAAVRAAVGQARELAVEEDLDRVVVPRGARDGARGAGVRGEVVVEHRHVDPKALVGVGAAEGEREVGGAVGRLRAGVDDAGLGRDEDPGGVPGVEGCGGAVGMPRRRVHDRRARGGVARDAAAAALREEPVERGGVAVCAVPGVVSDAGVFVQFRERAAGGADGVDHRAGAEGRDDAVGLAVERADRHGDEAGGEVRVAAAADGDGRREEAGAALQQVPDAVAAHRDAGRVDAVGVDGERGESVVQQLHRERERLGGALRHRVREGAPRRVDPLLPAGALRRHQDERQLPFPPPGEELAAAVHELQAVVRPAFARAVQQEDERDALAVPQVGRDVLPVGERRAGGVREDERLRRGGGLVHRERRADLRPLLRAFGGDGLACARGQGRKRSDE